MPRTTSPYDPLVDYLDRRLPAALAPCVPLSVPAPGADRADPRLWTKPLRESPGELAVVVAANGHTRDALLTFSDGDPGALAPVLLACLAERQMGLFTPAPGAVARVDGSDYLAARGLAGLLFLVPATLNHAARIAQRPRGALAGWTLHLVVPITDDEFRMARQDPELLFAHFVAVHRDLMTVEPPFRIPGRG